MNPAHVLVVDDEVELLQALTRLLRKEGYRVSAAAQAMAAADLLARHEDIAAVLCDLRLPGKSGLTLLEDVRRTRPRLPFVMLTAYGTVERAVEAMRAGASDFLVKPVRRETLLSTLQRALEHEALRVENEALRDEVLRLRAAQPQRLLGHAEGVRRVRQLAAQAARSDATLLITGESGTGKEVLAREIHALSRRHEGPFVPVHCAALAETLIESELFGHEAGAFTGAVRQHRGLFEAADKGTLFLDEVGEIPLSVQVKLLRVLQEGEVTRLGGTRPVRLDVRILAATHRDLRRLVAEGAFREDLYYRLHVVELTLPPLRERREDIPLLAEAFVHDLAPDPTRVPPLTRRAIAALSAGSWPGNVRELRNVLERALVLDRDGELDEDDLPAELRSRSTDAPSSGAGFVVAPGMPLDEVERRHILQTLEAAQGDKARASAMLGIGRRTIYRKLDEYRPEPTPGPRDDDPTP